MNNVTCEEKSLLETRIWKIDAWLQDSKNLFPLSKYNQIYKQEKKYSQKKTWMFLWKGNSGHENL